MTGQAEIRAAIARLEMDAAREASLVEELSQHLTDRYNELRGNGVDDAEACALLKAELNDGTLVAELKPLLSPSPEAAVPGIDKRERMLAGVGNDVRQALRLLRFNPGFAAVAILSLALGIGANTAIFELIDAVLMRTLPVPSPQQLADIQEIHGGRIGNTVARQKEFSFAIWDQLRQQQKSFSGIAAWSTERFDLGQGGEARYAEGMWVSGSLLSGSPGAADAGPADRRERRLSRVRRPRSCDQQRFLATGVWRPFQRHWQQALARRTSLRDPRCNTAELLRP